MADASSMFESLVLNVLNSYLGAYVEVRRPAAGSRQGWLLLARFVQHSAHSTPPPKTARYRSHQKTNAAVLPFPFPFTPQGLNKDQLRIAVWAGECNLPPTFSPTQWVPPVFCPAASSQWCDFVARLLVPACRRARHTIGDVQMQGLKLRADALQSFGLPVVVKGEYLLGILWRSFYALRGHRCCPSLAVHRCCFSGSIACCPSLLFSGPPGRVAALRCWISRLATCPCAHVHAHPHPPIHTFMRCTAARSNEAGHIGKLKLEIPWSQLSSKPVTILIDDLFLLAVPVDTEQFYSADREKASRLAFAPTATRSF